MNTTLFARLQLQAAFRRVIEQYGELCVCHCGTENHC